MKLVLGILTALILLTSAGANPADAQAILREVFAARTVDEWRANQQRFYDSCRAEIALLLGAPGWRLTDEEPMVITWFRLEA